MKKHLQIPLLLVALFLTSIPISAHDFEVDGIYYRILTDSTVEVTYKGDKSDSYYNEYTGVVSIPETVTSSDAVYSVVSVGDNAFDDCKITDFIVEDGTQPLFLSLSSYISWNKTEYRRLFYSCDIKTIYLGRNISCYDFSKPQYSPFYCQTNLESLTIGNLVTSINKWAFYDCTGLTTVNFNAENCASMGSSVFYGCSNLKTVIFGDNVKFIPDYAFSGCSALTSVVIPNSATDIGYNSFWGCDKLINANVTTTHLTATINITSPTQYNLGLYGSDSDKKQAENGVVKLTGFKPNETIFYYDLALIINGIYCPIKNLSFTTRSFDAILSGNTTATTVLAKGTYTETEGEVTILGEGINYGSKVSEYDGSNTIKLNNLDPNSSYTIYYAVRTREAGVYTASETFTTSALELTTQEAKPTSTTSVRLLAATNCDATEGTGFEWRRYDAPEEFPSNKVSCPVVDGVLVGSLRGVVDYVYYKYRPYYTSASGNTYYGEWIAFFTGDANVYFEPDVRTYEDIQVINNSATVKGYALEGTDVITAQGFEYWKTGSTIVPASTENRMIVNSSGISMSATLANLEYNSTYKYRAFVTTAKGTVYGDEVEFSTGNDPAGIDYIEIDADEFSVTLRENPATGTAWVKILGTAGEEVQYTITSMSGALVATGSVILDGEWNAIDLNCPAGMYLLTINDGTQVKTLRLIVK